MNIKQLLLTSALAMTMAMPAMAAVDIAPSATTADCDSGVLKTTSGSANLEANWDANTINLNWYADADSNTPLTVQTGAQTCTYDGNITLPATQPTKPGYTFDHWVVRQLFDLSTLDISIGGGTIGYSKLNGNAGANEAKYGLTRGSGEWATEFSYGTVKGTAYCSAKAGSDGYPSWPSTKKDNWTASESELTSASGEAKYCWCKPTGFDAEKDGSYVGVTPSSWVFNGDADSASYCAGYCANGCANRARDDTPFCAALYGVTQ